MDQADVLVAAKRGHNLFVTGYPGTGKTFILNQCKQELLEMNKRVAMTASTGTASTHIGGTTFHSWSCVGRQTEKELFADGGIFNINEYRRKIIKKTDVLIIDEISMIHEYQLRALDNICCEVRGDNSLPFGGLQVILSGDFFQLPPVSDGEARFVFESQSWNRWTFNICYLTKSFRQSSDADLFNILMEIRDGNVSQNSINLLSTRLNVPIAGTEKPVRLFSKNIAVDHLNKQELDKLSTKLYSYTMKTYGNDKYAVDNLIKG